MPAPQTIVTFRDEDDDEFPLSIFTNSEDTDAAIESAARKAADRFVASGDWKPTGALRLASLHRGLNA